MKRKIQLIYFICSLCCLISYVYDVSAKEPLDVKLTVKETAGVGIKEYPAQVVVPLPYGEYQTTDSFRLVDETGITVPAQFNVLNRWWGKDGSIRHVQIHFQPTVEAFTGAGTGISTYYLRDDGKGSYSPDPVIVTENEDIITVTTGQLRFTVCKTGGFDIIHEAWLDTDGNGEYSAEEQVVRPGDNNGGVLVPRIENITGSQYDSDRTDFSVKIEEAGPMRTVIRAEALTHFENTTNHTHGWAVRIYAYQGKPYIKVDYQLQNSAKNVKYAWPLYFESMAVNLNLNLSSNSTVSFGVDDNSVYKRSVENGLSLRQEMHDSFGIYDASSEKNLKTGKSSGGYIDVSDGSRGVMAATRYFWQTWPNGLSIDSDNKLSVELFPDWSAQLYQNKISPTGLYWLEDMQHTYKEMLFFFHNARVSDTEKMDLAKTFTLHPVVVVPTSWWYQTRCTLDMDGIIPSDEPIKSNDTRIPQYPASYYDIAGANYQFNWDNFMFFQRKRATNQTGDFPTSVAKFMVTEDPADYYFAEQFAMGELNVRPQWIAQYSYADDQVLLGLTENPYGGGTWRKFSGHGNSTLAAPYLDNTAKDANARDDQHGWFYHVEESYYYTGNLWIKDWYTFVKEFRKIRLNQGDPFPDMTSRAVGHSLHHALEAYRITGDTEILDLLHNYVTTHVRKTISPLTGGNKSSSLGEAIFQTGFLARSLITYLNEISDRKAWSDIFNVISGFMDWNIKYSNFSYYININGESGASSGASLTFVDPQMWYYLNTGLEAYLTHLDQYLFTGINGGGKPYGNFTTWTGQFENRYNLYHLNHPRTKTSPPSAVTDLIAYIEGDNINLKWTVPTDTHSYHLVWSDKPIVEDSTMNTEVTNWWAANTAGIDSVGQAGDTQAISINPGATIPFYAAIFVFDNSGNMSRMSNCAESEFEISDTTPPTLPKNVIGFSFSGEEVALTWDESTDNTYFETYIIYRNSNEVGRSKKNYYTDTGLAKKTPYSYTVSAVDYFGNESKCSTKITVTTSNRDYHLLVDFGATAETNKYDFKKWNEVIIDTYTKNVNLGQGGTKTVDGNNFAYNFQGIRAIESRLFQANEMVRVRWYNSSYEPVTFSPQVSFTDPDRPISGEKGTWYKLNEITLPALGQGESLFIFDGNTAGYYSLVNVNSNSPKTNYIVCDSIGFIANGSIHYNLSFDVNGDNFVDIGDVMACVDSILNGTNDIDVNGDLVTDRLDVMEIIDMILSE